MDFKKNANLRETTVYYIRHMMRYPFLTVLFILLVPIAINLDVVLAPLYVKKILDVLEIASAGQLEQDVMQAVGPYFLVLITLLTTQFILWRIMNFTWAHWQASIMRNLEQDAFAHIHRHSLGFFQDTFSGALVTRINRLTRSFETITDRLFFDIYTGISYILGVITVIYFLEPLIAMVFGGGVLLFLAVLVTISWIKLPYDRIVSEADTSVTAQMADAITNAPTIKFFGRKDFEQERFDAVSEDRFRVRRFNWWLGAFIDVGQGLIFNTAFVGLLALGVWAWQKEMITLGTVALLQMYLGMLIGRMIQIGNVIRNIYSAYADAGEMVAIINEDHEVHDPAQPEPCRIEKGDIRFKEVGFAYHEKACVFTGFNMHLHPGQKVGLVGHSGSGKSSLVKLLLRLTDIQKGEILIDGQNITHITQDDLRRSIAFVPQEPILFHRSLLENIRYGRPEATEEEVIEAAKKAHAHEFVDRMPLKYGTLVGERGVKLSGGERQRIAIARAILKDAPILVLDEATSSLDSESEKLIQDALAHLMERKTALVIAHRLSTIQSMDRIIVLDKGQIVEDGTHDDLVTGKGAYAHLWSHQAGGYIVEE